MEATGQTEALITQAFKEGRPDAFEMIFRLWYTPLCNFASTLIPDKDEAEEVVQSVFVNLWEKRHEVNIETSLRAYMFRSVRNSCLNVIKHKKVRREHERHILNSGNLHYADPEEMVHSELEERVAKALGKLPPQCRTVFELSRIGGKKYAEIALELGIAEKTVENHMGKALRILREELKSMLPLLIWWLGGTI